MFIARACKVPLQRAAAASCTLSSVLTSAFGQPRNFSSVLISGQRQASTFAGAESWLRAKAVSGSKRIFLFNLNQQLAKQSEALAMEKMYVARVEETFQGLQAANCHLIVDERSEYHLQAACLTLAAYRVMTDQLNLSKTNAIDILRRCMGDADSLGERAVRYSLQVCSKILSKDNYDALSATARQMGDVDMGQAFVVEHEETQDRTRHVSKVSGCFYHSFFVRHGAAELTGPIFCAAEGALFEKASGMTAAELHRGRVTFRLDKTLARGDSHCLFTVERRRAEKETST